MIEDRLDAGGELQSLLHEAIGATLTIDSTPGQGTDVHLAWSLSDR